MIYLCSSLFAQKSGSLNPVYAYGKNFGSGDPPMFFIHHFITLDSKNIESVSEPSGTKITDYLDEGITNPQLLSTMITTAIGKWGQVKIAGESIQRRLGKENIIDLMSSYDYPNETDYIVLGEINTLSGSYEIDLKIMDVSTQDIILSTSFTIKKEKLTNLRAIIESNIYPFMQKLLKPFLGFLAVKVNDTSRDFIQWDNISLRALKTQVGGKVVNTEEKDLRNIDLNIDTNGSILEVYFPYLNKKDHSDIGILTKSNNVLGLLEGDYELVAFLKGNKEKYKTFFEVSSGKMTMVEIEIDYVPPPPPKPIEPVTGSLPISNLFEGVNITLSKIVENELLDPKANFSLVNDDLVFIHKENYIDYNRNKTELLLSNLELGTYLLGAYTLSNETFPGKYYTMLYSYEDTVKITKRSEKNKISLPDKKNISGREVVIYLNPFPESSDEKYEIFLHQSKTPFSVVSNVGEVHIVGVPYDFSASIVIKRKGYKESVILIEPGKDKLYLHAQLTISDEKVKSPFAPSIPKLGMSSDKAKATTFPLESKINQSSVKDEVIKKDPSNKKLSEKKYPQIKTIALVKLKIILLQN